MLEDQDGHPEEPPPAYTSMPPRNSSPSHFRGPHPLEGLRFILLDGSEPLPSEWRRALAQHIPRGIREQFTVIHARLNELTGLQSKFDCIVSPANVHGRLGAG